MFQRPGTGFLERHVTDGQIFLKGFLDQQSPLGVADDRVKSGNHNGILGQPAGRLARVGSQSLNGPQGEGPDGANGDLHGFEQAMGDDRHHHVQFQLPGLGCQNNGSIATDDMKHAHVQHFGHHRVDLAGHDTRAGLDRWQADLIQPGGWTGSQQTEIIGNADKGQRQGAQRAREIGRIGHGLHRFEQVIGLKELQPGQL